MGRAWPEEKREALRSALRNHVCSVCVDARDDGSCGTAGRACALEAHFESIVDTVVIIDSTRMDDYVDAIRERVCSNCLEQDPDGFCARREGDGCALDSYLSLVVDAVEEVVGPLGRATGA